MANAKNTIQNIPLTGSLNLNTLKTDVSQFEGFNEKNSTVFGGELSPFYKKDATYGNSFNVKDTVPIVNSKGEKLFIKSINGTQLGIYSENDPSHVKDTELTAYFAINEFEVPDAIYATQFYTIAGLMQAYCKNGNLYWRIVKDQNQGYTINNNVHNNVTIDYVVNPSKYLNNVEWQSVAGAPSNKDYVIRSQAYIHDDKLYFIMAFIRGQYNSSYYAKINLITLGFDLRNNLALVVNNNQSADIDGYYSINQYDADISVFSLGGGYIYVFPTTGKKTDIAIQEMLFDLDTGDFSLAKTRAITQYNVACPTKKRTGRTIDSGCVFVGGATAFTANFTTGELQAYTGRNVIVDKTYNISPYYLDKSNFYKENYECYAYNKLYKGTTNDLNIATTGHNGQGFIDRYVNIGSLGVYMGLSLLDNEIVSLNFGSIPVTSANTAIDKNSITYINDGFNVGYSYKINDKWYSFTGITSISNYLGNISDLIKNNIIDEKYLLCLDNVSNVAYDLDTGDRINLTYLSYTPEVVPYGGAIGNEPEYTTAIYATGYNAGYENNPDNPFIGYLPNPMIATYVPTERDSKDVFLLQPLTTNETEVQKYLTVGDQAAAAKYNGFYYKYMDTIYPIDAVGNIIYPFCLHSKLVKGYYNNDVLQVPDGAYPLIYSNTNMEKYGYFSLSNVSNIDGTFTLQSQTYTYDKDNIYSVTFNSGIVSSIVTIAIKKNLEFLGALPDRAIFYSKYNKTFYQFTGDTILSKMFEASDIDEIYSWKQNPSTLSIWIHTDKGIYVISNTDIFRLNYTNIVDYAFLPEKAVFFLEFTPSGSENNAIMSEELAFYKQSEADEVIPIKLSTKYYGLGSEQKANYDCWYFRLHAADKREGYLDIKIHTVTDVSKETETKRFAITAADYDENNIVYIKYQPKYQSAVAMQIEVETNLAVYQLSLGVNANDTVAQMTKNTF